MADTIAPEKQQSLAEVRSWDIDYTNDMDTGLTVVDADAQHIPPTGGTVTFPTTSISGNIVSAVLTLGTSNVLGVHQLIVTATYSDGEVSQVRFDIIVEF